jgi:hypothetical protein
MAAHEAWVLAKKEYARALFDRDPPPKCEDLTPDQMCELMRRWFIEFDIWAKEVHEFCWGDPNKSPPPPKSPPIG